MSRLRKEYRQHSKSTLIKSAKILFTERELVVAALRKRWLRRVVAAAAGGFLAGCAAASILR